MRAQSSSTVDRSRKLRRTCPSLEQVVYRDGRHEKESAPERLKALRKFGEMEMSVLFFMWNIVQGPCHDVP